MSITLGTKVDTVLVISIRSVEVAVVVYLPQQISAMIESIR